MFGIQRKQNFLKKLSSLQYLVINSVKPKPKNNLRYYKFIDENYKKVYPIKNE